MHASLMRTIVFLSALLFSSTVLSIDYEALRADEGSKAKSAVNSSLRYLKRIEAGKSPERNFKKIEKNERSIKKRDPSYDFEKLRAVAAQARDIALQQIAEKKQKKLDRKKEKARLKAERANQRDREDAVLDEQKKFARQIDQYARGTDISWGSSENSTQKLKSALNALDKYRNTAKKFATSNAKMLGHVRNLPSKSSEAFPPTHEQSWRTYQERLATNIDKYQERIGRKTVAQLVDSVDGEYQLAELALIAANLNVGATLTNDAKIRAMSADADKKLAAIPPPAQTQQKRAQAKLDNAVFPKALYRDKKLEDKFIEAFERTGWGEKVIKVALKDRKWSPAFNRLGQFMGDTMTAWIGAVDSEGKGKVYDFRILNRGERYPVIRHDHEMVTWIHADKIR